VHPSGGPLRPWFQRADPDRSPSSPCISDGCDLGGYDEVGDVHEYLARLESAGSRTLDELLGSESSRGRPVRVVVYDAFLLWVPRVARQHGASCAAFFTQACSVNVV
jgi:pathogen-inducible salicylic acid glucosyltransferase